VVTIGARSVQHKAPAIRRQLPSGRMSSCWPKCAKQLVRRGRGAARSKLDLDRYVVPSKAAFVGVHHQDAGSRQKAIAVRWTLRSPTIMKAAIAYRMYLRGCGPTMRPSRKGACSAQIRLKTKTQIAMSRIRAAHEGGRCSRRHGAGDERSYGQNNRQAANRHPRDWG